MEKVNSHVVRIPWWASCVSCCPIQVLKVTFLYCKAPRFWWNQRSSQVSISFWPWWDSKSPLLWCVDSSCEQLWLHVKCRIQKNTGETEAEAGQLFWAWQALQHKYYHFGKSQLQHTLLYTKLHGVYYCLTEKRSAALTYLYMTLTPPDYICSDSEIGPLFFFFFAFLCHIYLN